MIAGNHCQLRLTTYTEMAKIRAPVQFGMWLRSSAG